MSLKILGGTAKGFPLAAPRTDTRPTSVMLKRKLFDWRQNLEGIYFLDVCAGSGAMGFEALSRGADAIALNDASRPAFQTIRKNKEDLVRSFGFEEKNIHVTSLDALKWIERELSFFLPDGQDSILFFDPPYGDHKLYREALALLKSKNFAGELWIEGDRLQGPPLAELTGAFHSVIKTVEQGDHFVLVGNLY